jgi:hypothetical protein
MKPNCKGNIERYVCAPMCRYFAGRIFFSETEYRPISKVHFGLSKGVEYIGPVWMKINISRQRLV